VANVLKRLLRELPESIFTDKLFESFVGSNMLKPLGAAAMGSPAPATTATGTTTATATAGAGGLPSHEELGTKGRIGDVMSRRFDSAFGLTRFGRIVLYCVLRV
jgi:hypothetical protein